MTFTDSAAKRIMKRKSESETLRSGTERGRNAIKTSKAMTAKPKMTMKSKSVKVKGTTT